VDLIRRFFRLCSVGLCSYEPIREIGYYETSGDDGYKITYEVTWKQCKYCGRNIENLNEVKRERK